MLEECANQCSGVYEKHLQEEGETGVSVGDVPRKPAALRLDQ